MIKSHSTGRTLNTAGSRLLVNGQNRLLRALSVLTLLVTSTCLLRADTKLSVSSVSASANDGNVPANALDGSLSTRWSAYGDGQWIRFDLGANQSVTSVAIAWYGGNQRVSKFEIRTSSDGATWTPVFSGVSSGSTTALENYNVADSTARYVMIVGHGNSASLWNSITEVNVFGASSGGGTTPPPTTQPPTSAESLLAVSSVMASADDGNVAANTLDRNLATRWSAYGDGQFLLYDLGTNRTISSLDVAWHKGDTRASKFEVHTSPDGNAWTTVFNGTSSGKTVNAETYNLADSKGRYVSIEGHGNSVNMWNSITEVGIYGFAAGVNPPIVITNPPPVVTNPPPVVTNQPPASTGSLPSKILDLANWKLTLPIDTAHAGSPDEIKQPELATFQDARFFKTNSALDGVVFTAPCGGYTTSGSGYPRSELREMSSGGSVNASWSTTSGTHTMEIVQAVTHLPVVKPHIVVGQIHDAADDVCVFRLEGTTLFVDLNGVHGPVITSNYQLGTKFTVKFVAHDGGVDFYYNGQFIYNYKVSTSGCYFKAGAYTQSNTSKGDAPTAYGEVVIYNVKVTHQ